jgi:hypothetical protein
VRRQEVSESKAEPESESDGEEELKMEIVTATRGEQEYLAQPMFDGGHFVDHYNFDWLKQSSPQASEPTPRDPIVVASVAPMLEERVTTDTLDVDSYVESLLNELGVSEKGTLDPLEKFGRQLAMAGTTKKRRGFVNAKKLAKNWRIGKEAAQRTIEVTTQMAVREFSHSEGGRMMKPISYVLNHRRLATDVYTDTMVGKCKSLDGNTCCQICATDYHYIMAHPMKSKAD